MVHLFSIPAVTGQRVEGLIVYRHSEQPNLNHGYDKQLYAGTFRLAVPEPILAHQRDR